MFDGLWFFNIVKLFISEWIGVVININYSYKWFSKDLSLRRLELEEEDQLVLIELIMEVDCYDDLSDLVWLQSDLKLDWSNIDILIALILKQAPNFPRILRLIMNNPPQLNMPRDGACGIALLIRQ